MLVERIMVEHVESETYVDRGPSELGYIVFWRTLYSYVWIVI